MNTVDVDGLTHHFGRVAALRDVAFTIPEGALYALLGPNGSGKTTLLQILMGLRRPSRGRVSVMGADPASFTVRDRSRIGYVAEGQSLPKWMRLREVEAYLAPLYDTWDRSLARDLRARFDLDPERKLRSFSRGEQMKAALLCALAPRPKLLVMDEPFTGMDAIVKDELVRGLLESSGSEGWTVLLCSHDIGELELLADWVGLLDHGVMKVSETMDTLRGRFAHVDVVLPGLSPPASIPTSWLSAERAGRRMSFVVSTNTHDEPEGIVRAGLDPEARGEARIDVREATLRDIFVALAKPSASPRLEEAAV